jgi:hypothetical protein
VYIRRLLVLALLVLPLACYADGEGSAMASAAVEHVLYGGSAVSATNPITVTTTAKNTDAIWIGGGPDSNGVRQSGNHSHSLYIYLTNTTSAAPTLTVQGSYDGTNFYAFNTAVTLAITTAYQKIWAVSVPVCKAIRLNCGASAGNESYSIVDLDVARY